MKPNFVTIFPVAQNVHLIKDIGQIGNALAEKGAYNSIFVCYKNSENYDHLNTEAKHQKIEFLNPSGRFLFLEKAVLSYLKKNANRIDVLHLFHLSKESIYYGLHYLKYNKSGKIYLKMDLWNDALESKIIYSKKWIFQQFHKRKEKLFLEKLALISAENPTGLSLLKKQYPKVADKAILLTNGVNVNYIAETISSPLPFNKKENIILSVGRIGAEEKNYKMLIEAIIDCELVDWKLILIGPIENDFDLYVKEKIKEHSHLQNKIELIGNIENREELYHYYNRSKIFCLTSTFFESFGIVFIEAMYFGNYVVGTTGISSFDFVTNDEELGDKVPVNNPVELAHTLKKLMSDEVKLSDNCSKAHQQIVSKFNWKEIVKPLIDKL